MHGCGEEYGCEEDGYDLNVERCSDGRCAMRAGSC
jgi:hypothetical protein